MDESEIDDFFEMFKLVRELGSGKVSSVYKCENRDTKKVFCVKFSQFKKKFDKVALYSTKERAELIHRSLNQQTYLSVIYEAGILSEINERVGNPISIWKSGLPTIRGLFINKGKTKSCFVTDLFGPSLLDIIETRRQAKADQNVEFSMGGKSKFKRLSYYDFNIFSKSDVANIGKRVLDALKIIHECGYVFNDISTGNIVFDISNFNKLFLIDLQICSRYVDIPEGYECLWEEGSILNYQGTTLFASLSTHLGKMRYPKDDIESLAYLLIYLRRGLLPWMTESTSKNFKMKNEEIIKMKEEETILDCFKYGKDKNLRDFYVYSISLKEGQIPNYEYLKQLLMCDEDCGNYKFSWCKDDRVFEFLKRNYSISPEKFDFSFNICCAASDHFKPLFGRSDYAFKRSNFMYFGSEIVEITIKYFHCEDFRIRICNEKSFKELKDDIFRRVFVDWNNYRICTGGNSTNNNREIKDCSVLIDFGIRTGDVLYICLKVFTQIHPEIRQASLRKNNIKNEETVSFRFDDGVTGSSVIMFELSNEELAFFNLGIAIPKITTFEFGTVCEGEKMEEEVLIGGTERPKDFVVDIGWYHKEYQSNFDQKTADLMVDVLLQFLGKCEEKEEFIKYFGEVGSDFALFQKIFSLLESLPVRRQYVQAFYRCGIEILLQASNDQKKEFFILNEDIIRPEVLFRMMKMEEMMRNDVEWIKEESTESDKFLSSILDYVLRFRLYASVKKVETIEFPSFRGISNLVEETENRKVMIYEAKFKGNDPLTMNEFVIGLVESCSSDKKFGMAGNKVFVMFSGDKGENVSILENLPYQMPDKNIKGKRPFFEKLRNSNNFELKVIEKGQIIKMEPVKESVFHLFNDPEKSGAHLKFDKLLVSHIFRNNSKTNTTVVLSRFVKTSSVVIQAQQEEIKEKDEQLNEMDELLEEQQEEINEKDEKILQLEFMNVYYQNSKEGMKAVSNKLLEKWNVELVIILVKQSSIEKEHKVLLLKYLKEDDDDSK